MKILSRSIRIVLTITALLVATNFAFGQERQVKRKNVPIAVLNAFKVAYPNATIKGYAREREDGKTFYEIESVEGAVGRDVLYNPDGTVAEVEETIALNDLPTAIQEAIHTKYPRAVIVKAEKTVQGDTISYEVIGKQGRKRFELEFDTDGNLKPKSK
jgi:Putative beta-lactamase-inhibitor-like, PepSY-like